MLRCVHVHLNTNLEGKNGMLQYQNISLYLSHNPQQCRNGKVQFELLLATVSDAAKEHLLYLLIKTMKATAVPFRVQRHLLRKATSNSH